MGANRWLFRPFCFQRYLTSIHMVIPLSSSGAVGTVFDKVGVTSVVKTSTGLYTITLDDVFPAMLGFFAQLVNLGTETLPLIAIPKSNYSLANKTFPVVLEAPNAATATDVTVACELHVQLHFKNSSVPR